MASDLTLFSLCILLVGVSAQMHTTRQGCTCTSDCGATLDFGNYKYDWCYTANNCGSYSISRLSYYDYCVYPPVASYESQTAAAKQSYLWSKVTSTKTAGSWLNALGVFTESVETTFIDFSDIMNAGRKKFIHSVGAVAQISFVASSQAKNSGYTGIFNTGATGLLRLSTAKAPSSNNIVPGFGLKLMRDGVASGNLVAMPSLDGQSDFNIWKNDYRNHVAFPSSWALKLVAQKFTQASNCPLEVGLSDIAAHDRYGNAAGNASMPWKLTFVPDSGLTPFPSAPYGENAFLSQLEAIPANSALFQVYATEAPGMQASLFLGTITTTSAFTRSSWADQNLFFRHTYMENDFKLRPQWLGALDALPGGKKAFCGTSNVGPTPPVAMETKASPCPFSGKVAAEGSAPCPFAAAALRGFDKQVSEKDQ